MDEAFRQPARPYLNGMGPAYPIFVGVDNLRATAPNVGDDCSPIEVDAESRSEIGEPRLLVSGDDAHLDACLGPYLPDEILTVAGIPHGARGDPGDRIGTHLPCPLREVADGSHGVDLALRVQIPGGINRCAETDETAVVEHRLQRVIVGASDQKPDGV